MFHVIMNEIETVKDEYEELVQPYLGYVGNMLRWGAPVAKICSQLGISEASFTKMGVEHKELATVIKEALLQRDEDIQRAFFESAIGSYHTDVRESLKQMGNAKIIERTETTRWHKADARVLSLLLMNTDPWFLDKTRFTRELEQRAQEIRERIASSGEWKPADTNRLATIEVNEDGERRRRRRK